MNHSLTMMRFISNVNKNMFDQTGFPSEQFTTDVTALRFISSVINPMLIKMASLCERFRAHFTAMMSISTVNKHYVSLEFLSV